MKKKVIWEKLFIILIAIMVFIWICMFSEVSGDIQMKIYYEEYPANSSVSQLVVDIGEGFSIDHVITTAISNVTELEIKKDYANRICNLRIDFTDAQGKIKISKIEIKKNGFLLKKVEASELRQLCFPMHDVLFLEEQSEVFEIDNSSNDGYVGFSEEFIKELNSFFYTQIQEKYLMFFMEFFTLIILWNRIRLIEFIKDLFERVELSLRQVSRRKKIIGCSALFIIGVLWCYRDYIFGRAVFVFSDVACDSYNQTYPNLYHYADLISKGQNIYGWDFTEGLGAAKSFLVAGIGDWVILCGTEVLPYLMGISQIIKVFLAYAIMYFYLKVLGRKELSAHIGAMSYSLCGYMMVRQFWKSYPNIVVLTVLVLLCLELFISKQNRKWLSLSLFAYCINMDSYTVCLMFAMLVGYSIFRYFQMNDTYEAKEFILLLLQSIGAYCIGVLASAICFIPSFVSNIGGDRFKTGGASLESYLFSISDFNLLKTAFFRTISNDWCGYDANFTGWGQIASAPSFYCGIFMLVLIPLAVSRQKRGQKISSIVAILCCFLYVFFPGINYMLNGFAEIGFRLSSIWVYYIIIYLGTVGLDFWLDKRVNKLLICSLISLMVIISVLSIGTDFFNRSVYIRTMIILFLFVMLAVLSRWCGRNILYILTLMLVVFDLFSNSYIFCATPMKLTTTNLDAYKDGTIEWIKKMDSSSFYRIEKEPKVFYCDSLYQDYYGTNQYSGYINDDIHRFFSEMEIPRNHERSRHVLSGLSNINSLYTLLGVKYIITDDEIANDYGLEKCDQVNGREIYINTKVLPIGFCYDNVIYESDFNQMNIEMKRKAILDSCVLNQGETTDNVSVKTCQDYVDNTYGKPVSYVYDKDEGMILFDAVDETAVIVFDFVVEGMKENYNHVKFGNEKGELGSVPISCINGDRMQHVELCGNELSYIQLESPTIKCLKDIEIRIYDKNIFYKQQTDYINDRCGHAMQNVKISKNRVEGNIKNEGNSILFFSIPYDVGWHIYVDGIETDLKRVNYGFIGTALSAGEHDIVLQYKMPYINVFIIISVIGVVLMTMWFIFWTKREREEKG